MKSIHNTLTTEWQFFMDKKPIVLETTVVQNDKFDF